MKQYSESAVRFLRESGSVDGDVEGYIQHLEQRLVEAEDVITQLDTRIGGAVECLQDTTGMRLEGL